AQWVSWIHIDDLVGALLHVIEDPRLEGPIAMCAPSPIRQRELAKQLGRAMHRPAVLRTPRGAVVLALGEASRMLLGGQRVRPLELLRPGYLFRFPTLALALRDLLADLISIEHAVVSALPDTEYLRARRPRYTLHTVTELDAPLADVFEFFSSPA